MTPAVTVLDRAHACYELHEYDHDPAITHYGPEAAEKLGISPERLFKTLVVTLDSGKLAVAVLPVSLNLNLKTMANVLGAKKAQMAKPEQVERSSGYVLGGVSPIGQKKSLATIVDSSAQDYSTIFISAGRRGLEIELAPELLCLLTKGCYESVGVSK
jgi:Cys-tRNA(Pro)/Cys-tRNA(Cys) deacylase